MAFKSGPHGIKAGDSLITGGIYNIANRKIPCLQAGL